jgi:Fic family protein
MAVGKSQTEMQQEVRNYWRALEWIEEQIEARRPVSEQFIRELHGIILVRGLGRRGLRSRLPDRRMSRMLFSATVSTS